MSRKVKGEKEYSKGIITDTHYSVVHTDKIRVLEEKVKALEEKVKVLDNRRTPNFANILDQMHGWGY